MISSAQNAKIKNITKLNKSSRERRKQGAYIVEGKRMVSEIKKEDLLELYVTDSYLLKNEEPAFDYEIVSDSIMKEIAETVTPQGILAVVKQHAYSLDDLLSISDQPLFIVLENLQDPGNLGTIIRTAEGAGVTGIIMSKDTVDVYNTKTIRATMGSMFRVPFAIVDDIKAATKTLHEKGVVTLGAHLSGENFYGKDYKRAVAFYIGNEGNGLTDSLTDMLKEKIKIPMLGSVESLNAATAATVLMYEAMRQRMS